ncbi:hypothetical protein ABTX80_24895 [Streptomyces erythrochromogenes]|uniref:hypothetical protein n=1 Tax=Streptomyces erythrochromogenes TaxID=285574 RepID=UPI0033258073
MSQQPAPAARYRTRPTIVDAIRFDGTHASVLNVMHFVDAGRGTTEIRIRAAEKASGSSIEIPSPDGWVCIDAGDWLMRDANGRLARYSNTVFTADYEPLPDGEE